MEELTNKQHQMVELEPADMILPEALMEDGVESEAEAQLEDPGKILFSAEVDIPDGPSTTSALRISQIRLENRRKRMFKVKQGLFIIGLIMMVGLTYYGLSESGLLKLTRGSKAGASELGRHAKDDPLYNCFGTVGNSSLKLSLPGKTGDVIGVGFHQAERREAIAIKPTVKYFDRDTTATVRAAAVASKSPVLFVMSSRGRGSAFTSAMDIAMVPGAAVYSPVDGVVTVVKTYNLYGKLMDYQVDIRPDGYPDLRVAIIHIDNIQVTVGQRVHRREDMIGWMRPLPDIVSQINNYLPQRYDHVHVQVNPASAELTGKLGS